MLAAGLFTAGFATLPILRSSLIASVDATVEEYSDPTAHADQRLFSIITTAQNTLKLTPVDGARTDFYIAMYDFDGNLIATAGGVDEDDEQPAFPEKLTYAQAFLDQDNITTLAAESGSGSGFRAIIRPQTLAAAEGYQVLYTMVLAMPTSNVDDFAQTYLAVFTLVSIATVIIGALVTRGIVTLTFRRFGQVESTAMEIAGGDFSQRMTDIEPRTEIGRLKIAINTMLDRIDDSIDERDATVQQMRRFVGDASHELRTPLVSVRGYAELFRMGALQDDEAVAKAMERIEAEAKRMGVLVEDLLALTRLDEKREVALHPVDLRPLARDAALDMRAADPTRAVEMIDHTTEALTQPIELVATEVREQASPGEQSRRRRPGNQGALARAATAAGRSMRWLRREPGDAEVAPLEIPVTMPTRAIALPPVVLGDEDKIRQLMSNLLGNARRYSPDGSPIGIEVGVTGGFGWMAIVDHGEGIPESIREKIFQRFWRADTSRARETGGSGLGLSIVASIVDSLHGRVAVEDTPGGGATFRVSIPLAPASFTGTTSASAQVLDGGTARTGAVETAPDRR